MANRNWKRTVPNSINEALRLCKEHGLEKHNLSVERIADRMAASVDTLYKWLGTGRMPVNQVINYESLAGRPFVTEYMAHSQGYLLIKMPSGRQAQHKDVIALNIFMQQLMAQLLELGENKIQPDEVLETLKVLMQDLAYQHKNIEQQHQRQLDL